MSDISGNSLSWGFPSNLGFTFTITWIACSGALCRNTNPATYCQASMTFQTLCKPHITYSCILHACKTIITSTVPPSGASQDTAWSPEPQMQWPLCIFDNLGMHFLWWPLPWRSCFFRHHLSDGFEVFLLGILNRQRIAFQPLLHQPLWAWDCSTVVLFSETLRTFVCVHLGHNFELLVLPSSPDSSFFMSLCSICSA